MPAPNIPDETPTVILLIKQHGNAILAPLRLYRRPLGYIAKRREELPSRFLDALHAEASTVVCPRPQRAKPQTKGEARSA